MLAATEFSMSKTTIEFTAEDLASVLLDTKYRLISVDLDTESYAQVQAMATAADGSACTVHLMCKTPELMQLMQERTKVAGRVKKNKKSSRTNKTQAAAVVEADAPQATSTPSEKKTKKSAPSVRRKRHPITGDLHAPDEVKKVIAEAKRRGPLWVAAQKERHKAGLAIYPEYQD